MPRPLYNTTQLPKKLLEELGLKDTRNAVNRPRRNRPLSRKERRKAERSNRRARRRPVRADQSSGAESDESSTKAEILSAKHGLKFQKNKMPKSILKKRKPVDESDAKYESDESESGSGNFARPAVPTVSRGVQDKLAEDDAQIEALEKALGIKDKKKLPKSFRDDGLDELFCDLNSDSESEARKRKREGKKWLERKRRKAERGDNEDNFVQGDAADMEATGDEDESVLSGERSEGEEEDEENGFKGFGAPPSGAKIRENPYAAPVTASVANPSRKYIPPSRRATSSPDSEAQIRLRRQVRSQLNKLSEANFLSILGNIESLYQDHPRQNVTSTLVELLLGLICDIGALSDTFIILHAGFIAGVYKVMGMDFGAELVQKMVETFDCRHNIKESEGCIFRGKEPVNLMSLLSQLYNLSVIGSGLVFDYIRLFLTDINELNTELLLKIIRNSGPRLRQDDPSALRDIVLTIQPAISRVGEAALSVRTKFMIDTITDLKNNRMKTGAATSSVSAEHLSRVRKILGSLNTRTTRASEPLRIGRMDIHKSAKNGKWWLVGASWKEEPSHAVNVTNPTVVVSDILDDVGEAIDLAQLAKTYRMNTDVRRSIFVAIMSASDYRDAHLRLAKLHLKRRQELEIPPILIHCAAEEEAYNPYYTLIARKLCSERKIKVAFAFSLWGIFKRMGERGDMNGDLDGEDSDLDADNGSYRLNVHSLVNLAKMYGNLISDGVLALGILKTLDFAYLKPKTRTFVELLLITVILQTQQRWKKKKNFEQEVEAEGNGEGDLSFNENALADVFLKTRDTPQVAPGLIYFLRKVVAKSDVMSSKREKKVVTRGCRIAVDTLRLIIDRGGDGLALS